MLPRVVGTRCTDRCLPAAPGQPAASNPPALRRLPPCRWDAATGGANVPAINDLLTPYGVALESAVVEAEVKVLEHRFNVASGTMIKAWPAGGWVHRATVEGKIGGWGWGGCAACAPALRLHLASPVLLTAGLASSSPGM